MVLNIALLLLLFGAAKKKFNPYGSAAIFGAIKGVIYFITSQSVIAAVIGFIAFGGLASALVYFVARLDRKEVTEAPYSKYGTHLKGGPFKWEYIPVSIIVILIIFGELLALVFQGGA